MELTNISYIWITWTSVICVISMELTNIACIYNLDFCCLCHLHGASKHFLHLNNLDFRYLCHLHGANKHCLHVHTYMSVMSGWDTPPGLLTPPPSRHMAIVFATCTSNMKHVLKTTAGHVNMQDHTLLLTHLCLLYMCIINGLMFCICMACVHCHLLV